MRARYFVSLAALCLLSLVVAEKNHAQTANFQDRFNDWKDVRLDPKGTFWIWSNRELRLYTTDSLFLSQSFNSFGNIHSIDPSNPLKALAFFKEQGRLVFLDNSGSPLAEGVQLMDLGMDQATAACLSYDNGFWLFLSNEMRLVRFDKQLNITVDVPNVHVLAEVSELHPVFMAEAGRYVFILDNDGPLLVFDIFGGFMQKNQGPKPGKCMDWHTGGVEDAQQGLRIFRGKKGVTLPIKAPENLPKSADYWMGKEDQYISISGDSLSFYRFR